MAISQDVFFFFPVVVVVIVVFVVVVTVVVFVFVVIVIVFSLSLIISAALLSFHLQHLNVWNPLWARIEKKTQNE